MKKKVHKQAYPLSTIALCGSFQFNAEGIKFCDWVFVSYKWKHVTCKLCLKKRKKK